MLSQEESSTYHYSSSLAFSSQVLSDGVAVLLITSESSSINLLNFLHLATGVTSPNSLLIILTSELFLEPVLPGPEGWSEAESHSESESKMQIFSYTVK